MATEKLTVDNVWDWYNANPTAEITPEIQKLFDDYFVKYPIDLSGLEYSLGFSWDRGMYMNTPEEAAKAKSIGEMKKKILAQGTSDKWSGEGFGSKDANANAIAEALYNCGINRLEDFGKVPAYTPVTTKYYYNGRELQVTGAD